MCQLPGDLLIEKHRFRQFVTLSVIFNFVTLLLCLRQNFILFYTFLFSSDSLFGMKPNTWIPAFFYLSNSSTLPPGKESKQERMFWVLVNNSTLFYRWCLQTITNLFPSGQNLIFFTTFLKFFSTFLCSKWNFLWM
jgi:hypothetical protein